MISDISETTRLKYVRWSKTKTVKFLRFVCTEWTEKFRREVDNYLFNKNEPRLYLGPGQVKQAALALRIPDQESKSLQIKFIRIIKSFKTKPLIASKLNHLFKFLDQNRSINFLNNSESFDSQDIHLRQQFSKYIDDIAELVMVKRKVDLMKIMLKQKENTSYDFIKDFYNVPENSIFNQPINSLKRNKIKKKDISERESIQQKKQSNERKRSVNAMTFALPENAKIPTLEFVEDSEELSICQNDFIQYIRKGTSKAQNFLIGGMIYSSSRVYED